MAKMRKLILGTSTLVVLLSWAGEAASQEQFTVVTSFEAGIAPGSQVMAFRSESQAEEMMARVLAYAGLRPNFVFRRDDSVGGNIAVATLVEDRGGDTYRLIAYSQPDMTELSRRAGTEWALMMVLAHEVGHHVQGHIVRGTPRMRDYQEQADEYAGFVLNNMGATLEEARAAMTVLGARSRIDALTDGWNRAERLLGGSRSGGGAGSTPAPSGSPSSAPGPGAEAAIEAILRLEGALGDRLDEVEEIVRGDLALMREDMEGALAESEARVVGAIATGMRETTEAIRAAVTEEALLTREAIEAQGVLTRVTVVDEATRTRSEVNRVMWLLLAFSALAMPLLMLMAFRRPRQHMVRVVERASTRVRALGQRSLPGQSRTSARRAHPPAHARAPARQLAPTPGRPALVLAAGSDAGSPRKDLLITDRHLRPGQGFVIGRHAPHVHGVVDHPTVSRRHARITREGSTLLVEDLDSSNGTRVNGVRLRPRTKQAIRAGDSVQLGGMGVFSVRPQSSR